MLDTIETIDLPPGYRLEWGGEFEASVEAEESLGRQLPLGFLVMLIISILLFGRIRQPLIIWLVVPMSACGVVLGLLGSGLAFGFMALLGFLSLSGMLMKNAIVLVDEIDAQIASGRERFKALVDASVSRLRPVTLAAVTTILGMAPLLADAFFRQYGGDDHGRTGLCQRAHACRRAGIVCNFLPHPARSTIFSTGAPATVWATTGCRVKEHFVPETSRVAASAGAPRDRARCLAFHAWVLRFAVMAILLLYLHRYMTNALNDVRIYVIQ